MLLSGDVLWLGPRAPWAAALDAAVHSCAAAADLPARGGAALVVVAGDPAAAADWLRRPRERPPALVVADGDDAEEAALQAGADEAVSASAPPEDARRAVRRALARHAAAQDETDVFRLMVECATDLLTLTDADGRTLYASPAAEELTGAPAEDLVGREPFASVHPDDLDRVRRAYVGAVAAGGAPVATQYRVRDADGCVRVVESVGRPACAGGRTYGVVSTRDVTERVEMEERLRDSEARYRAVVRALPDVVSRLRHDGWVVDFHVPPVFETEFPAEAMLGRRLQDVIQTDIARKFADNVGRLRETGRVVSYDYEVEVMGETRHREVRLAPLGDGEVISMIRDVTALRQKTAALQRSRTELRALATHLQDVREEERARLSREVHDVLGQQLTAIRLGIGWFGRRLSDNAEAQARLAELRETIDETIGHVRQVAADLRPGVLDDFGLASAAEWQVERFAARTGVEASLAVEGTAEVPTDVATAAFRVLQEALTNVARHADARSVDVTLDVTLGGGAVRLTVADDGRGFDGNAVGRRTLGLLGMRERAGALGGTLDVRGVPGRGTVVECTLPLAPPRP
ncbi:PAS domain S-box protein [Rubrivirga sp. S365]|uniref:PAS domain-containing sensor histidine kinase n=1 Tax=Rubrivirga sp. S365 TaxID=3076080 RepID=UPI0028C587E8|nr:PAS domain S-box protein [Rubrivirga sp. S365]MDT7856384.1 PAS domain S-box protein [Rubrivirga sp. S365]